MAEHVRVELGERSYAVWVHDGAFEGLGDALLPLARDGRVVVVSETNVAPLWADALRQELERVGLRSELIVLPAGEANKTLETWSLCVDALLEARVDRRCPIVALGGGVLGDITGFAAASALRGLPFVQVPTTVLAMVDSSVGGKTAVNHARGKNLVGAFHQPVLVWAGLHTLSTLDPAERLAGLGEVAKTGLLGSAALLEFCEQHAEALAAGDVAALREAVAQCVAVKASVVARDEREGGVRAWLNAGHTVGHGIEAALGYGALRHGEAVAIGLVAEVRWAEEQGHCELPGLADRLERLLLRLGLPVRAPALDEDAAVRAMCSDKKLSGARVKVPVPRAVSDMVMVDVRTQDLHALLAPALRP